MNGPFAPNNASSALPGAPIVYYVTEVGLSEHRTLGRQEESRLPMPPFDQWDLELWEYYRDLIQLRCQAAPFRHPPKLRWLDDGVGSVQWQIGDFDLLVNYYAESPFAMGPAVPVLASHSAQLEEGLGGMLRLPAWSAVVLRQR